MTRLPYPPQYLSDKAIEMGRSCKRPAEFAHEPLPSLFLCPIGAKLIQVSLVGWWMPDVLQGVDFLHSYSTVQKRRRQFPSVKPRFVAVLLRYANEQANGPGFLYIGLQ